MVHSYDRALDRAIVVLLREAGEHAQALGHALDQVTQLVALRSQLAQGAVERPGRRGRYPAAVAAADQARTRCAGPPRPRLVEPADRAFIGHLRAHGQESSAQHFHKIGSRRPDFGCRKGAAGSTEQLICARHRRNSIDQRRRKRRESSTPPGGHRERHRRGRHHLRRGHREHPAAGERREVIS